MTPTEPTQGHGEREQQGPEPSMPSSAGDERGMSGRGREGSRRGARLGWIMVVFVGLVVVAAGLILAILVANSDDSAQTMATVRFSESFKSEVLESLTGRKLVVVPPSGAQDAPTWTTPVGSFAVLNGT